LQREGRASVSGEEWQYAVDQRWTEDPDEPGNFDELFTNVVDARKTFGQEKVEIVQRGRGVPGARKYALSLLLAEQADARPDVAEFRCKHLAGRFLEIGAVQGWVLQKAANEIPATRWAVDVPIPDSSTCQWNADLGKYTARVHEEIQFGSLEFKNLRYPKPDCHVGGVRVRPGGTLWSLYGLAAALAHDFGWSEAEAVMFILTGDAPPSEPAKCSFFRSRIPCLSRIILTVDPALSPRQVQSLYRTIRAEALRGRYRNLTQKHALLAAFTASARGKLSEQMREWNAQYPRWKYKAVTIFGRDSKAARDRLLMPVNFKLESVFGVDNAQKKTR
jgi:hypothetical protein